MAGAVKLAPAIPCSVDNGEDCIEVLTTIIEVSMQFILCTHLKPGHDIVRDDDVTTAIAGDDIVMVGIVSLVEVIVLALSVRTSLVADALDFYILSHVTFSLSILCMVLTRLTQQNSGCCCVCAQARKIELR